jgi:hypothetical protein
MKSWPTEKSFSSPQSFFLGMLKAAPLITEPPFLSGMDIDLAGALAAADLGQDLIDLLTNPHIVVGFEKGLFDSPLVVLLDVPEGLQVFHRHQDVLADPDLDRKAFLVGARVVIGVHSVAPPVDNHRAEQGPERILSLDGFEIEISPDPVGHAVDDRGEFVDDIFFDFNLKQAAEHCRQDFVGVGGHLATFCC